MKNYLFAIFLLFGAKGGATPFEFQEQKTGFQENSMEVYTFNLQSTFFTAPIEIDEGINLILYNAHTTLLEDDGLMCEINITVTVRDPLTGSTATVSGKISGPCEELKAAAVNLMRQLVNEAKEQLL